jgi:hypothetical protein
VIQLAAMMGKGGNEEEIIVRVEKCHFLHLWKMQGPRSQK